MAQQNKPTIFFLGATRGNIFCDFFPNTKTKIDKVGKKMRFLRDGIIVFLAFNFSRNRAMWWREKSPRKTGTKAPSWFLLRHEKRPTVKDLKRIGRQRINKWNGNQSITGRNHQLERTCLCRDWSSTYLPMSAAGRAVITQGQRRSICVLKFFYMKFFFKKFILDFLR